jgi:hypothetical protein
MAAAAAVGTDQELVGRWETVTNATLKDLTGEELMDAWDELTDARDEIVEELQTRGLYPTAEMERWEAETGAYPSLDDPRFLQKLLAKREFAESLQTDWKPKYDSCGEVTQFEVTPVQRFVANFMNPRSPYQSALLYHGVGVGKTCSAIQIAEAWLETFPRQKVIIITPPTIRAGFLRTIFDADKSRLQIGEGDGIPNNHVGCTGNRYLELTGTVFERDRGRIERRVQRAINRRYTIMGYMAFANYIRDLLAEIKGKAATDPAKYEILKGRILRREFSGKLLIIDEAHNLRDTAEEIEDADNPDEIADSAAGKMLTPHLLDVLKFSEGMKLALMTATPMYDNYREIIFLLNLMLLNDKKARLTESKIFEATGAFKAGGEELLAAAAKRYVSFMRGENPLSFPIRLKPRDVETLDAATYPELNPRSVEVPEGEKLFVQHLPIVAIPLKGEVLAASAALMDELPEGGAGLSSIMLEKIVQAGNFVAPATEDDAEATADAYRGRIGEEGLATLFTKEKVGTEIRYKAPGDAAWLGIDQIGDYSPKFEFLLRRLAEGEGVAFVYSRFVQAGALPLALTLEANGYTPVGRRTGLLGNGIQTPGGRQCALCP